MMEYTVLDALTSLERERGSITSAEVRALKEALAAAYKRAPKAAKDARVEIDTTTGTVVVYKQDKDEDGNVLRELEDTPRGFDRIAAQEARRLVIERLRKMRRDPSEG